MAGSSSSSSSGQSTSESYIPDYLESPILRGIAQEAQRRAGEVYQWGMDQFNRQQGDIDALMRDALSYASPQRIAQDMGMAEAGVQQAAEAGRQNAIRDLESFGIDPSSGRYAALDSANRVMAAAAAAGAGNQQRMADIAAGNAMRQQALAAGLQNTQLGYEAGNTANRFLATAMALKYPPLGTRSQSTQSSSSQSQSTDAPRQQPQQPNQQGDQGGNRGGGGGAGGGGRPTGNLTEDKGQQGQQGIPLPRPRPPRPEDEQQQPGEPQNLPAPEFMPEWGWQQPTGWEWPEPQPVEQDTGLPAPEELPPLPTAEDLPIGEDQLPPLQEDLPPLPTYDDLGEQQVAGLDQGGGGGGGGGGEDYGFTDNYDYGNLDNYDYGNLDNYDYGNQDTYDYGNLDQYNFDDQANYDTYDYGDTSTDNNYDFGDDTSNYDNYDYGNDTGYDNYDYGNDTSYDNYDYGNESYDNTDYSSYDYGGDYAKGGPVMRPRGYAGGGFLPRPPRRMRPPGGMPTGFRPQPRPMQPGMGTAPPPTIMSAPGLRSAAMAAQPAIPGRRPLPPPPGMARGGRVNPTQGGFVSHDLSPSRGARTDDVNARLNAGEFVIPKDVAHWKGKEFFYKLIAQARRMHATGGAKPSNRSKTGYAGGGPVATTSLQGVGGMHGPEDFNG